MNSPLHSVKAFLVLKYLRSDYSRTIIYGPSNSCPLLAAQLLRRSSQSISCLPSLSAAATLQPILHRPIRLLVVLSLPPWVNPLLLVSSQATSPAFGVPDVRPTSASPPRSSAKALPADMVAHILSHLSQSARTLKMPRPSREVRIYQICRIPMSIKQFPDSWSRVLTRSAM